MINAVTGDTFDVAFRAFLRMIDVLLQCAVKSITLAAPPGSPANGDRYIVAASPTGAWAGQAKSIAVWTTDNPVTPAGLWEFYAPKFGWLVPNLADGLVYLYSGSAWAALAGGGGGSSTLAGDTDVLISSPANNDVLTYVASASKWENKPASVGSSTLAGDTDVVVASPANAQVLAYDTPSTKWKNAAAPYDVPVFAPGVRTVANEVLVRFKVARAVTFPAAAQVTANTSASANATASTTFTFKKNGTSFATVNFAAGAAVGTWTMASDAVFAAGDLFEWDGPATADATLADVSITFAGIRS